MPEVFSLLSEWEEERLVVASDLSGEPLDVSDLPLLRRARRKDGFSSLLRKTVAALMMGVGVLDLLGGQSGVDLGCRRCGASCRRRRTVARI